MNESIERELNIYFLNGEVIRIKIPQKLIVNELLIKINEYIGIKETHKDSFELCFIDEK